MKPLYFICCIAVITLMPGIAAASDIATVHGVAYEWSTFEPLDNAIIEVNSTPAQSMVAKYGVYSFELSNGTYQITASYYEDNVLTYYAEDVITVSDEGSYVLDLLLLPSYSSSGDLQSSVTEEATSSGSDSSSLLYGSIVVVFVLLLLLAAQMKQRPGISKASSRTKEDLHSAVPVALSPIDQEPVKVDDKNKFSESPAVATHSDEQETDYLETDELEIEEFIPQEADEVSVPVNTARSVLLETELPARSVPETSVISDEPVPADLQEILDILKSQGGRMTQKDMRKRLKYSEGKVSLMLLDLEKRGKIQKFKKGRGNVLFLVGSEE